MTSYNQEIISKASKYFWNVIDWDDYGRAVEDILNNWSYRRSLGQSFNFEQVKKDLFNSNKVEIFNYYENGIWRFANDENLNIDEAEEIFDIRHRIAFNGHSLEKLFIRASRNFKELSILKAPKDFDTASSIDFILMYKNKKYYLQTESIKSEKVKNRNIEEYNHIRLGVKCYYLKFDKKIDDNFNRKWILENGVIVEYKGFNGTDQQRNQLEKELIKLITS